MICKDSVLKWFKGLSSHNRIDLMCSLLNKCLPFELRFMGTCLEDLGRQDFTQMKDFEVKANNVAELSEFQVQCIISDTRTRQKLALYVCLLHSLNTACSTLIYKSLYGIDISDVVSTAKNSDGKILEELLTIYTVAVNHPAFSFEQRSNLGSILLRLSQEESRLQAEKLAEVVSADYSQSQLTAPESLEAPRAVLNSEMPTLSAPPGLGYPPGLSPSGNFIQVPMYHTFSPQQLPHQPIVWQFMSCPVPPESLVATELPPPYTASPLMSRHSSPSQSAQHSRAGSPASKQYFQRGDRNHLQPKTRPSYTEQSFANPPPLAAKPSIFDASVNDSPGYLENEIRGVSDRMAELSTEERLRGAVVSLNGMAAPAAHQSMSAIPPPRLKMAGPPLFDPEVSFLGPQFVRPLDPIPVSAAPPSVPPLTRAPMLYPRYHQPSGGKSNSHGSEDGRNGSSSSGSNASSTSHSPPVTPANLQHTWDKGYDQEDLSNPKPRTGAGRGRGRFGAQGVQTLPRERGPMGASSRRQSPRSAPPTPHEEKKTYMVPPPVGEVAPSPTSKPPPTHDMLAPGMSYAASFVPGPFTGPPMYPPYAPTLIRPPYTYPNGDILYAYQPQPPAPFLPSPLVTYSSSVPPPKIACYNCSSQTHHPNDCKEPTMEEYSSKGQYRIDYGKSNELVSSEK